MLRFDKRPKPLGKQQSIFRGGSIPLYHPSLDFVISISPRAGSTVVLQIFLELIGEVEEALKYSNFAHRYENEVYKKRPGYIAEVQDAIVSGAQVLHFVRDPAARAISIFEPLLREAAKDVENNVWFSTVRGVVIKDLYASEDRNMRFSFVDFLRWRAMKSNESVNPHLREQYGQLLTSIPNIKLIQVEKMHTQLAEFPLLAAAYRAAEQKGLLTAPHHKKKVEIPIHEVARVLSDPDYIAPMPKLTLLLCSKINMIEPLEAAFPNDIRELAPLYLDPSS